jgi:hypothetical protein
VDASEALPVRVPRKRPDLPVVPKGHETRNLRKYGLIFLLDQANLEKLWI